MAQYRKKPVVIEAIQWDGTYDGMVNIQNEEAFMHMQTVSSSFHAERNEVYSWGIKTLEGAYYVSPGDWIIKGIKNGFYPCKPNVFEKTHESVSEETEVSGEVEAVNEERKFTVQDMVDSFKQGEKRGQSYIGGYGYENNLGDLQEYLRQKFNINAE